MLVWIVVIVTTFEIPAFWMLGYWFVAQVVGGFGSIGAQGGGTAFWAHVGGFVAGAALIFLFRDPELVARHPHHGWR
jgi:membrane associated rhomboid family serine protease